MRVFLYLLKKDVCKFNKFFDIDPPFKVFIAMPKTTKRNN
tara:strand:+ start:300 stop:419 length:120 start_codon:yes stop_codon:yes gene_type:complete